MCAEVEYPLGLSEMESSKVDMSRACCCSVSHADSIASITTMQYGYDAMRWAREKNRGDLISMLEQVVGECGGK